MALCATGTARWAFKPPCAVKRLPRSRSRQDPARHQPGDRRRRGLGQPSDIDDPATPRVDRAALKSRGNRFNLIALDRAQPARP